MISWNDIDALMTQMEENGLIRENGRVKSYGERPDGRSDLRGERRMERLPRYAIVGAAGDVTVRPLRDTIVGATADVCQQPNRGEASIAPPPADIAGTTSAGVTKAVLRRWRCLRIPGGRL